MAGTKTTRRGFACAVAEVIWSHEARSPRRAESVRLACARRRRSAFEQTPMRIEVGQENDLDVAYVLHRQRSDFVLRQVSMHSSKRPLAQLARNGSDLSTVALTICASKQLKETPNFHSVWHTCCSMRVLASEVMPSELEHEVCTPAGCSGPYHHRAAAHSICAGARSSRSNHGKVLSDVATRE